MSTNFTSTFANDMQNFLKLQEALDFNPESYRPRLKQFDAFITQRGFPLQTVNKDVVLDWVGKEYHESNNGRRARLFAVNKFLKYLYELGRCEYIIPKECFCKAIPYSPYLFSDEELSRFFSACDCFSGNSRNLEDTVVLPVVFRMIYCCAMRPGEAFRLRLHDVDLSEGTIQIRQSKHHKDRLVWMSEELHDLCRQYDRLSEKDRLWFFSRPNGDPFIQEWLEYRFKQCIKIARIGNGTHSPRIYDFRHSACSRVLLNWLEKGEDVASLVCSLREHMGHSSFSHTLYYLHILPENLLGSTGIDWESLDGLYPSSEEE